MQISIVVPTYRRPGLLEQCLHALETQDFDPVLYEIIIADDAASEETRAQAETHAANSRMPIRYVPVVGRHGPAAARNVGWQAAQGEIIAFTDDDCQPDPRWLGEAMRMFAARPELAALAGRTVVPLPALPTDYELDAAGLEYAEFVTANCFCRRDMLARIGGFDERYTAAWREDSDLQFAILAQNGEIGFAGNAVVTHPVRPAPWGVSLRQQRKSQFDALLYKKYPALYRRHIQPGTPWDYYAIVLALAVGIGAALTGQPFLAFAALIVWFGLTGNFLARRLQRTARTPGHVAEMAVTSVCIPFLSVFWRLCGAVKFRVLFL